MGIYNNLNKPLRWDIPTSLEFQNLPLGSNLKPKKLGKTPVREILDQLQPNLGRQELDNQNKLIQDINSGKLALSQNISLDTDFNQYFQDKFTNWVNSNQKISDAVTRINLKSNQPLSFNKPSLDPSQQYQNSLLKKINSNPLVKNKITTLDPYGNLKLDTPSTEKISNWGKFKQGVNKVMNSKAANYAMQGINIALGFMGDNDKDINSWDATTKQLRGGIENGLISSDNPFLAAIGFGSKGLGKLGAYGDASSGLGLANDIVNTLGSFIPGVGWIAKKTKELQKYQDVMASTGYTGVTNDVNKAAQNAGGRFLDGVEKQNARRDRAQLAQEQAHEVLEDNKLALQNSGNPLYQLKTQVLTSGGYNTMSAKNGAKLYNLQEAKRILSNRLQSFKQGGAVNVIPDGALHKNRHHLEDIDEKFEDVTTKGIPVITEAKNGDIIQQAEVEKEEIIFNLEVTKKLEELMEKGTDEAAIEAGKLLTEEILRNTIDNTKKLL